MAITELWLKTLIHSIIIRKAFQIVEEFPMDMWKKAVQLPDMEESNSWIQNRIFGNTEHPDEDKSHKCVCEAPVPQLDLLFQASENPDNSSPSFCLQGDPIHVFLVAAGTAYRFFLESGNFLYGNWKVCLGYLVIAYPTLEIIKSFLKNGGLNGGLIVQNSLKVAIELTRYIMAAITLAESFCCNYYYLTSSEEILSPPRKYISPLARWIPSNLSPVAFNSIYQVTLWLSFTVLVCSGKLKNASIAAMGFLLPMGMVGLLGSSVNSKQIATTCRLALLFPMACLLWHSVGRRFCRLFIYTASVNQHLRNIGSQPQRILAIYVFVLGEMWLNLMFLRLIPLLPMVILAGEFLLSPTTTWIGVNVFCWNMIKSIVMSLHGDKFSWQLVVSGVTDGYLGIWATICFLVTTCGFVFPILEDTLPSGRSNKAGLPIGIQMVAWVAIGSTLSLSYDQTSEANQAILKFSLLLLARELEWRADLAVLKHYGAVCPPLVSAIAILLGVLPGLLIGIPSLNDVFLTPLYWLAFWLTSIRSSSISIAIYYFLVFKTHLRGVLGARSMAWEMLITTGLSQQPSSSLLVTGIFYCWDMDAALAALNIASISTEEIAAVTATFPRATSSELINQDDVCPVCREVMTEARVTPCRHYFHEICLEESMSIYPHCPMCRGLLGNNYRSITSDVAQALSIFCGSGEWEMEGRDFLAFILEPFWVFSKWSVMFLECVGDCGEVGDPKDSSLFEQLCAEMETRNDILDSFSPLMGYDDDLMVDDTN